MTGSLILGPGLFVLGAFFVLMPYVAVRIFGVVLIGFAALTGNLAAGAVEWIDFLILGAFVAVSMAAGAVISYRLTRTRVTEVIEESRKETPHGESLLVPYARDGTWFHPGLAYSDGNYRIGQRGEERVIRSYRLALRELRQMPVACWRRPSPRTGLFSVVSAVQWAEPPQELNIRRPSRATVH